VLMRHLMREMTGSCDVGFSDSEEVARSSASPRPRSPSPVADGDVLHEPVTYCHKNVDKCHQRHRNLLHDLLTMLVQTYRVIPTGHLVPAGGHFRGSAHA
jgi:hypothetical protein